MSFPLSYKHFLAGFLAVVALTVSAQAQTITVQNPGFGAAIGGHITGTLDLNALDAAPSAITQQLGSSSWYGQANVTTALTLGFRPQIEVNDTNSAGKGRIDYGLGASLGGLLGLEMPDSYLWQPLTGVSLQANKTYVFSIDMDAASLLDLTALGNRGFGIGVSTGASTTSPGTLFADSLSNQSLLGVSLLGGTNQRMTLTFTTGANPTAGTAGLVVFAGRGTQTLNVSLLSTYTVDNASFATVVAVPEPSSALMVVSGLSVLGLLRPRRRETQNA
jgi:hypothetical protein